MFFYKYRDVLDGASLKTIFYELVLPYIFSAILFV